MVLPAQTNMYRGGRINQEGSTTQKGRGRFAAGLIQDVCVFPFCFKRNLYGYWVNMCFYFFSQGPRSKWKFEVWTSACAIRAKPSRLRGGDRGVWISGLEGRSGPRGARSVWRSGASTPAAQQLFHMSKIFSTVQKAVVGERLVGFTCFLVGFVWQRLHFHGPPPQEIAKCCGGCRSGSPFKPAHNLSGFGSCSGKNGIGRYP